MYWLFCRHNLRCDESAATGESKTIKKNVDSKGDCIIISGSKVVQGFAKVVVVAVGVNSHYGRAMTVSSNLKSISHGGPFFNIQLDFT